MHYILWCHLDGNNSFVCEVWGSHGNEYLNDSLLRCSALYFGRKVLIFWRQQVLLKCWYLSTKLTGIMSQRFVILDNFVYLLEVPDFSGLQSMVHKCGLSSSGYRYLKCETVRSHNVSFRIWFICFILGNWFCLFSPVHIPCGASSKIILFVNLYAWNTWSG